MVEYDSIIPPGRAGKIIQQIAIAKLNDGPFTKSVNVITNAQNMETFKLSLSGKIMSIVNVSSRYLSLRPDSNNTIQATLEFNTEKGDFQIIQVSFKDSHTDGPEWQKESVTDLTCEPMKRSESPDANGYYTYTLTFSTTMIPTRTLSGTFILTTNHPKMDTITIRGILSPN